MKQICIIKENGLQFVSLKRGITIEEYLEKHNPEKYIIVETESIPKQVMFMSAWEAQNDRIVVNIEKAKSIKNNHFRYMRKPILEKLDVEFILALENDDLEKKKEIVEKKKQLRDVTKIDMPDDLDELEKFIPEILKTDK